MKLEGKKEQIVTSLFWKLAERGGSQGIQFLIQIMLARLVLPEDYGIIGLVAIFISIGRVFVQSGLSTALVQKKDPDNLDFSSVFYLSLGLSVLLYLVLFFLAPFVADYYGSDQIVPVLRVLSITLLFGTINSVQNAVIARNLEFKKLFLSSTGAVLISGIVAVIMAHKGFSVWALVWQQIINEILFTLTLWFTVQWRPELSFSFTRVKSLFAFGWKLLVSYLIDTLYRQSWGLIIGKVFNPAMLGFYNRGEQFPSLVVTNVNGSIQAVMFPVLASQQDDRQRVVNLMRRSIVTSSFIIFPMMVGLTVIAEPLIVLLLTPKWLPSVPFLQIFCMGYALWPIHTANLQAINALGRSDIFLKLEIFKKAVGIIVLAISISRGVYAIALGGVVTSVISTFINAYPNKQLLGYGYKEQWSDIMPSLVLSLLMGVMVYGLKWLSLSLLATLTLQVTLGAILYVGMAWMFKLECFRYLVTTAKELGAAWRRIA